MEKIRILISSGDKSQNYIRAIEEEGAACYGGYLPGVDTGFDGLILCGGGDVSPERYGEENDGSYSIDLDRDRVEFELIREYVNLGKPILGICRGCQILNVFFGGSLYQDLPEAEIHKSHDGVDSAHKVSSLPNSILSELYGESFTVNSSHHQAVKRLGDGFCVSAVWQDKYIEAIEHESAPIIAVQWHPERMRDPSDERFDVSGSDIFKYFIDLCERYKSKNK